MLALLHIILAAVMLWAGWVLAVDVLLALIWAVWDLVAGVHAIPDGMWAFMTAPTPWSGQQAPYIEIGAPPELFELHLWSMGAGAATALLLLLGNWLVPLGTRIQSLTGNLAIQLDDGNPLVVNVVGPLARQMGVRVPSVWLVPSSDISAFAVGAPGRGAVVLTAGAIHTLGQHVAWVVAHELAHLKYGDSISRAFWISGMRAIRHAARARHLVVWGVSSIGMRLPVVRLLMLPISAFLILIAAVLRLAETGSRTMFKLIDRYIGRAMEYRADMAAADAVNAGSGIEVLMQVAGHIESDFGGIFATHPPLVRRIERLRRMETERAKQSTGETQP